MDERQSLVEQPTGALQFRQSAAIAAQQAEVQGMLVWAERHPRSEEAALKAIENRCESFAFADAAVYRLERENKRTGEKKVIQGFSVRFSEEIDRQWPNTREEMEMVSETAENVIFQVSLYDLERNKKWQDMIMVSKVIERSYVGDGQQFLYERKNTKGYVVYGVRPSAEEMRQQIAALKSKCIRNLRVRLLPSDAQELFLDKCIATKLQQAQKEAGTSEGQQKIMVSFGVLGVTREQIEKWLGHPMSELTADEWVALRGFYRSMRDEGLSWQDTVGKWEKDNPEAARAKINLDDIKVGDPANHTDVSAPIAQPEADAQSKDDKAPSKAPTCQEIAAGFIAEYKLTSIAQTFLEKEVEQVFHVPLKKMSGKLAGQLADWLASDALDLMRQENFIPMPKG